MFQANIRLSPLCCDFGAFTWQWKSVGQLCPQLDSVWLLPSDKRDKCSENRNDKIVFGNYIQDRITIYVLYLVDGGQEKLKYKK